jgi:hypothetical protein
VSAESVALIPECAECDARSLPADEERWAYLTDDELAGRACKLDCFLGVHEGAVMPLVDPLVDPRRGDGGEGHAPVVAVLLASTTSNGR